MQTNHDQVTAYWLSTESDAMSGTLPPGGRGAITDRRARLPVGLEVEFGIGRPQ